MYELLVMQLGLCNAPPTFQRMIDNILVEELDTRRVFAYVDDILITTEMRKENQELMRRVLHKL